MVLFVATADRRVPKRRLSHLLVLPNLVCVSLNMTAFIRVKGHFFQRDFVHCLQHLLLLDLFHLLFPHYVCSKFTQAGFERYFDPVEAIQSEVDSILLELLLLKLVRLVDMNLLGILHILELITVFIRFTSMH